MIRLSSAESTDKNWVKLIVDAEMVSFNDFPAVGARQFIFDKPFMILLRESSGKQPYFASWIANNELMQAAD